MLCNLHRLEVGGQKDDAVSGDNQAADKWLDQQPVHKQSQAN